jgi:hypothetical protein
MARTYDIEVYIPSMDKYYEVSSVSNAREYQARRGNMRYKRADGKLEYLNTLNGSGLATSRLMVALIETFQNKDGKYTLWYAEGGTAARVLSIWFRPAGGRAVNFSDHEVEGIVDFGVNGKKTRDLTQMQHFDSATNQGENFRPYWQGLYDQAISAALASLARRK